jgi:pre-mRNA-splicing factor ISY1
LGEFKIRNINDQINNLIKEYKHWCRRIKELGGADYLSSDALLLDADGKEVPGSSGYKYFGAAKELPGVRELFFTQPPSAPK